mmetsp:Transcript_34194/g.78936  ORF Transcript_34194/g.78936 Transcript_34194/m.78936 type:complete len:363 (-) Transcript_34194:1283-2371(-)
MMRHAHSFVPHQIACPSGATTHDDLQRVRRRRLRSSRVPFFGSAALVFLCSAPPASSLVIPGIVQRKIYRVSDVAPNPFFGQRRRKTFNRASGAATRPAPSYRWSFLHVVEHDPSTSGTEQDALFDTSGMVLEDDPDFDYYDDYDDYDGEEEEENDEEFSEYVLDYGKEDGEENDHSLYKYARDADDILTEREDRLHINAEAKERCILVGVEDLTQTRLHRRQALDGEEVPYTMEESLDELRELASTAGMEVSAVITQRLSAGANPRTYIGTGKVRECAEVAAGLGIGPGGNRRDKRRAECCTVVVDAELSPGQQRALENEFNGGSRTDDWMDVDVSTILLLYFFFNKEQHFFMCNNVFFTA